ncbi:NAD-dependent epimerase/dehydratase family protein [Allorhizobium pseudoryzae]|uniref:NAD-dependent epimerase/dehydratase family protein n=1 Tax=Allorhizobium pseudoryzae TaxID=379684 RepID=UPI003CFCD03E
MGDKILVTGANGMLGRAIARSARMVGKEVVPLTRNDVDLLDRSETRKVIDKIRPKMIFHAAAKVHGLMGNKAFPADMFNDNIRINTNVVEAAQLAGVEKFIAVGTVASYPDGVEMPIKPESIWQGPPHTSEAAYGHAKRAMLAHLQACSIQYGLQYAYAIMTNIYGPEDRFDELHGHVIPSLVSKFHTASLSQERVEIWGTGKAKRDFIYSEDAADALLSIADNINGPVNVATGRVVSIRRVVEILQNISGVTDVVWNSSKPDGQLLREYDIHELERAGFKPRYSLEEGLEKTYKWYAEHHSQARKK